MTSSPPAGHHWTTAVPLRTPPSQSYRSTGVYPLWYIYGEDKDEVFPRSMGYTQRGTHTNDSNNGIRARLPLCNPNPNWVKAKLKRDQGGGCYCLPVTTATAWGGKEEHRRPHRRATRKEQILVQIKEQKGEKDLKNPNPNPNRVKQQ